MQRRYALLLSIVSAPVCLVLASLWPAARYQGPGTALAQGTYPINDNITISIAGGSAQCDLVELLVTSLAGHEDTWINASGATIVRSWSEKSGYTRMPVDYYGSTYISEWYDRYNGPVHFIYRLTGATEAVFWAKHTGGQHEGPFETTPVHWPITGPPAGPRLDVSTLHSEIDADGKSKTSVYVYPVGADCGAARGQTIVISTTRGTLSVKPGQSSGATIEMTTDVWNGTLTLPITLTAGTDPGIATVTASGLGTSASTQVRMRGNLITVTVDPDTLPADGHTAGLLTALLLDDQGVPVAGKEVTFHTNLGQLAASAGGSTGSAQTATTNSQGEALAVLVAPDSVGVATITASYRASTSDQTEVTFVGYALRFEQPAFSFRNVAGKVGGDDGHAQRDITAEAQNRVATRYGRTRVMATVVLSFADSAASALSTSVGDQTIELSSPQREALGTDFVWFGQNDRAVTAVTTSPNGQAVFDIMVKDLWLAAAAAPPEVKVTAQMAANPSVQAELTIPVRDNLEEVITRYQAEIGAGPALDPAVAGWPTHATRTRSSTTRSRPAPRCCWPSTLRPASA